MPGPVMQSPSLPWWADPKGASVLDKPGQGMLRQIVGLLGLDDPTQIMAVGVPVEAGANTGGMLEVLSQKFPRLANAIKAYHGSPHDFERFDASKIGTGEGAQAYGHGLYFAEAPEVAQEYKRVLGNREFKIGDRSIVSPMGGSTRALDMQTRAENIAAQALDDAINAQSSSPAQFAANQLRYAARHYPEEGQHIDEALNLIAKWQESGETHTFGGKMYEVAIHAHPDQFLDWDKPLSQQPEAVRKALQDMPTGPGIGLKSGDEPTGGDLYEKLGQSLWWNKQAKLGDKKEAAAAYLRARGVPGIKYLDQGSRAAGEGSHNYVVFDDRLVDIRKKYGIVATVAGAGAANQPERKQ